MNDEKLIEVVKRYSALYDVSNPRYMDPRHKIDIWMKIGDEMNLAGSVCKSRWQNIRDHFRKHLMKNAPRSSLQSERPKKYKYETQLQFLLPHFTDSPLLCNVKTEENNSKSDEAAEQNQQQQNIDLFQGQKLHPPKKETKKRRKTSSRNLSNTEQSPTTSLPYFVEETGASSSNLHPMDAFLMGLAPTLRNMSVYNQHLARNKLFAVVQEMDLKDMQEKYSAGSFVTPAWSSSESNQASDASDSAEPCDTSLKGSKF